MPKTSEQQRTIDSMTNPEFYADHVMFPDGRLVPITDPECRDLPAASNKDAGKGTKLFVDGDATVVDCAAQKIAVAEAIAEALEG